MAYNLEDLPALDEGFADVEIQWGWICHACNIVTPVNDWNFSWNNETNNSYEICSNQACKHVHCEYCQTTNNLDMPFQQDDGFVGEAVLGGGDLMGQLENLESFEATWNIHDPQLLPIEVQAPTAEQPLENPDATERLTSTNNAALDANIQGPLSSIMSEEWMAAFLNELLGSRDDPDGPDVYENSMIDPNLEDQTSLALEAQTADRPIPPPSPTPAPSPTLPSSPSPPSSSPPSAPQPPPSPPPRQRLIPCPCQHTHGCTRTFHLTHHATRHAQIHTHPYACPSARCASRFVTSSSLRAHTTRIHSPLQHISDLDERFKGPLVADAGPDGKGALEYPCRFREVLGCKKRFGQNGHANRHSLGHCKRTWNCNFGGCRERFVVRANWEWHRWSVHGVPLWDFGGGRGGRFMR